MMGDMLGARVELEVTGVAHGGVFVARHDGRVVFVADTLPGERVLAEITDDSKRSFWRAAAVEVIEPSPHRRRHVWDAASIDRSPEDRAGGAEFGHIDLAEQRGLKASVLAESLERMAGVTRDIVVESLPSGASAEAVDDLDGTGWRTRTSLHVDDRGRIGPMASRSHRVIPVDDIPLSVPDARYELSHGAAVAGAGRDRVDIVCPSVGQPRILAERGSRASETISELVGDREFRLDVRGFWQVHRHAAATLSSAVQDAIVPDDFDPDSPNLDLYGGVGLLAAAVADRFGTDIRITSVESDAVASAHARDNLGDLPRARPEASRVDRYLARVADGRRRTGAAVGSGDPSRATIVVDPPRSGAGRQVVDAIARLAPLQVVYVACDPVALARDVALFAHHGYELGAFRAFDLFPCTHHVEAVATLRRR